MQKSTPNGLEHTNAACPPNPAPLKEHSQGSTHLQLVNVLLLFVNNALQQGVLPCLQVQEDGVVGVTKASVTGTQQARGARQFWLGPGTRPHHSLFPHAEQATQRTSSSISCSMEPAIVLDGPGPEGGPGGAAMSFLSTGNSQPGGT